jgi:hypothetical protein
MSAAAVESARPLSEQAVVDRYLDVHQSWYLRQAFVDVDG